ncbi:MAG: tetratricopeptide repeat protein [Pyrinomonadaceae bacterium]
MRSTFFKILFGLNLILLFFLPIFGQDLLPILVKKIKPSAVAIETFDAQNRNISRGSGFFISKDLVITNRHVIEKSNRVEIRLVNGKKFDSKGVVAIDGEGDLALLQVDVPEEMAVPLPIIQDIPQEGESILVIGNPFGLEGSISNGIVSAVREFPGYGKIIQITAAISPGSSGSPVVNMRGQVIGVATLQAAEGQNLNFAVPSERIAKLKIDQLRTFSTFSTESAADKRASAESFYSQGLGLLSRDDYQRALGFFEKAVDADPTYAEAWYQIGYCYGMLGRHSEALSASKQAARLRPRWSEIFVNIGASNYALKNYEEAAQAYRQAAKLNPYKAETQYSIGLTLNKLGRTDEEILAYKRAIALKPDYAGAFEMLGTAYFSKKQYAQSLAVFEQLKVYKPDARTYNFLGQNYFELGKTEESLEAFSNAVNFNPQFDEARYNLGRAYLKLGDRDSANIQYEILRNGQSDWADKLYVLINP